MEEHDLHLLVAAVVEVVRQDADDDDFIMAELFERYHGRGMLGRNLVRNAERDFSGIENYVERTVTGCTDVYFKKHFRMSLVVFVGPTRTGKSSVLCHFKLYAWQTESLLTVQQVILRRCMMLQFLPIVESVAT